MIITPAELERYLGPYLQRNLGIDPQSLKSITLDSLGDGFVILKADDKLIPGYLDEGYLLENLIQEDVLRKIFTIDNHRITAIWKGEGEFTIKRDPLDVTNIHAIMFADKEYHLKVYANMQKAAIELEITKILANQGLYPEVQGYAKFDDHVALILWDRVQDARNLDESTGKLYIDFYNNAISIVQLKNQLIDNFKAIITVLNQFWGILEKKLLEVQNINWLEKIDHDWKILSSSEYYLSEMDPIKQELISWIKTANFSPIHGDCWLRQFIKSDKIYLLDLEDIVLGPREYDMAGVINSILQQAEYFSVAYPTKDRISFRQMIKELIITFDLPVNLRLGMKLRALHELSYLLVHQKDLKWLIEFICNDILMN
ncbi:MAG: hypothetical protein INQ03_16380 [Candidatus Heimdallarchaeota archaeon]|nr:hypothetical protein [Candidatus Heimdallarchaeota archaeon]